MGWCSATDIMDAAMAGAEAAVRAVLEEFAPPGSPEAVQAKVDEVLRPYVRTIAAKLRDGDWDCIEESDYFDRFPQEMLGYDDAAFERWLREQLEEGAAHREPEDILSLSEQLKAHTDKMEASKN
jgi:hypothetical protein